MEMKYIQIFSDKVDLLEPFDDAERGRLLTAMLSYGLRGEEIPLSGNERFIWPVFRQMLDASRQSLEKKSKAGSTTKGAESCANGQKESSDITQDQSESEEITQDQSESASSETDHAESKTPIIQETRIKNQYSLSNKQEKEKGAKPPKSPTGSRRFSPPSVDDVAAYCREKGYDVDAQAFVAFYESNGWKVGKNPMRNWYAAVQTWVQREKSARKGGQTGTGDIMQRYTPEERRRAYGAAMVDFDADGDSLFGKAAPT